jgi:hypothetical protein
MKRFISFLSCFLLSPFDNAGERKSVTDHARPVGKNRNKLETKKIVSTDRIVAARGRFLAVEQQFWFRAVSNRTTWLSDHLSEPQRPRETTHSTTERGGAHKSDRPFFYTETAYHSPKDNGFFWNFPKKIRV